MRSAPEYRQAETLFRRGEFVRSAALIDGLLRRPGGAAADPEAAAFLRRQAAICRAAASGRPTVGVNPPPPAVAAALTTPPAPPAPTAPPDCGPRALLAVLRHQGVNPPPDLARLRRVAGTGEKGTSVGGVVRAAKAAGFAGARGVHVDGDALARLSCPAVAWVDARHFIAVLSVRGDTALVRDPNEGAEETIPLKELLARSGGVLVLLEREAPPAEPASPPS